jgi:hypothetical protein
LSPETWLNSAVIDDYFEYSIAVKNAEHNCELFHCFNSSFMEILYLQKKKYDYDAVKHFKVNKKSKIRYDLNKHNYIFIPVNISNLHWILIFIDTIKSTIWYCDSYLKIMETELAETLMASVEKYLNEEESQNVNEDINKSKKMYNCKILRNYPQQTNGYDCGVYVCIFAKLLMKNLTKYTPIQCEELVGMIMEDKVERIHCFETTGRDQIKTTLLQLVKERELEADRLQNVYIENINTKKRKLSDNYNKSIILNNFHKEIAFNAKNVDTTTKSNIILCGKDQQTAVNIVSNIFEHFVRKNVNDDKKMLLETFSAHIFLMQYTDTFLTIAGQCHQEVIIKYILKTFDEDIIKKQGCLNYLKSTQQFIQEQLNEAFKKQNFEISNMITNTILLNDSYRHDNQVLDTSNKKKNITRQLETLIRNIFEGLVLIYSTQNSNIHATKDQIILHSMKQLRIFKHSKCANTMTELFNIMYKSVVTTSTKEICPLIENMVQNTRNKTFVKDLEKNTENFKLIGVNVPERLAKRTTVPEQGAFAETASNIHKKKVNKVAAVKPDNDNLEKIQINKITTPLKNMNSIDSTFISSIDNSILEKPIIESKDIINILSRRKTNENKDLLYVIESVHNSKLELERKLQEVDSSKKILEQRLNEVVEKMEHERQAKSAANKIEREKNKQEVLDEYIKRIEKEKEQLQKRIDELLIENNQLKNINIQETMVN